MIDAVGTRGANLDSRHRHRLIGFTVAMIAAVSSVAFGFLTDPASAAGYGGPDRPCRGSERSRHCRQDDSEQASVGLPIGTVIAGTSGVVSVPGTAVPVVLAGYLPGTMVTLSAYSTPIRLGSFRANAAGEIRADVTLPAALPAGNHHFVAEGRSRSGTPLTQALAFEFAPPGAEPPGAVTAPSGTLPALLGFLLVFGSVGAVAAQRRLRTAHEFRA